MATVKSFNKKDRVEGGVFFAAVAIILLLFVGWIADICQVIAGISVLKSVTAMSGLLLMKAIAIFLGPIGSIFGLYGLFH